MIIKSLDELVIWGRLVKFSHTIFALPFAFSMFVILSRDYKLTSTQFIAILLALVSARTAAMAFNRLVDKEIDALNPRTYNRELPSGVIAPSQVWTLVLLSSSVFLLSSYVLGVHCLILAPLVLAILFLYSYTKRFTQYSHLILGLSLALAPGGVWYALTNRIEMLPVYMMGGVLFWVAGFDILYSCQDIAFDRAKNLYSVPAIFGMEKAFLFSKIFHAFAIFLFFIFGVKAGMGLVYFLGLIVFALVLASQHFMISPKDLSKLNAAFFTRNGVASIVYLIAVVADIL